MFDKVLMHKSDVLLVQVQEKGFYCRTSLARLAR